MIEDVSGQYPDFYCNSVLPGMGFMATLLYPLAQEDPDSFSEMLAEVQFWGRRKPAGARAKMEVISAQALRVPWKWIGRIITVKE